LSARVALLGAGLLHGQLLLHLLLVLLRLMRLLLMLAHRHHLVLQVLGQLDALHRYSLAVLRHLLELLGTHTLETALLLQLLHVLLPLHELLLSCHLLELRVVRLRHCTFIVSETPPKDLHK
jgi:hypothetical protein